jgi:hypothetical protein
MAATLSAKTFAPPKMVSRDSGQLVAICQVICGNSPLPGVALFCELVHPIAIPATVAAIAP